jgi:cytochrome oxidase Cu insertion factor (SCO1/SenC/PrrC family)
MTTRVEGLVATGTPSEDGTPGRPRWRRPIALTILIGVAAGVAIGGAGSAVIWMNARSHQSASSTTTCDAIGCTYLGTPAPGFTLTDQTGRVVSLAHLRGEVVILEFMDPVCTDICPIVSAEFERANDILGSASTGVAFVGVNVNQYRRSPADLRSYSAKHGLSSLRNWYFLTGSTPQLRSVWARYGITVEPNPDGDVVHTSVVYFIDPGGRIRFAAFPDSSKAGIPLWGRTIAATVRHIQSSA